MAKISFIIVTTLLVILFASTHAHFASFDVEPDHAEPKNTEPENIFLPSEESQSDSARTESETIPESIILNNNELHNAIPLRVFTLRPINHRFLRPHGPRCHHRHHHHHHNPWDSHGFGRELSYGDDMIKARWMKVERERPMNYGTRDRLHRHEELQHHWEEEKRKKHEGGGMFKSMRKFLNHF